MGIKDHARLQGTVCNSLETEYDEINDIFHTRCVTFTDQLIVYDKNKYPL